MKKIIYIIILIVLVIGIYSYLKKPKQNNLNNMENNQSQSQNIDEANASSTQNSATTEANPELKKITLSEIAKHNTKTDCWTTIDGKVYDLSSFVPNHPGGDKILAICGIDGTEIFRNQHDHNQKQADILVNLQIGDLVSE